MTSELLDAKRRLARLKMAVAISSVTAFAGLSAAVAAQLGTASTGVTSTPSGENDSTENTTTGPGFGFEPPRIVTATS